MKPYRPPRFMYIFPEFGYQHFNIELDFTLRTNISFDKQLYANFCGLYIVPVYSECLQNLYCTDFFFPGILYVQFTDKNDDNGC